jgi:hypothetical protein
VGKPVSVCTRVACTDSPEAIEESLSRGERSEFFRQVLSYLEILLREVEEGRG